MQKLLSVLTVLALLQPSFAFAATNSQQMLVTVRVSNVKSSGTVAKGTQRIPMLNLEFENPRSDLVSVYSVVLHHEGLGSTKDIERVYAMMGGQRVSQTATIFTSDGEVRVRFSPAIKLQLGGIRKVGIFIDISENAVTSGEHRLAVHNSEDIDAGGSRIDLRMDGQSLGSIIRTAPVVRGKIALEYLKLPRTVQYGPNQTLARIKLSADKIEDQWIYNLTLTNDGKARGEDLQNLVIESSRGVQLSSVVPTLSGPEKDKAKFLFNVPVLLKRLSNIVLVVKGSVSASRKQTIRLIVEEPSDITAAQATKR